MQGLWLALIADVKASRDIPARLRPRVDLALKRAAARTLKRFDSHFRLAPQVLRGDELQAVLRPDAPVLSIVTYVRAHFALGVDHPAELRAGIGRGTIARLSPKGPFASDGEAFHRAREALDHLKKRSQSAMTAWSSGDPLLDAMAATVLGLTDALASRWTRPQLEAIAGRLEDKGLHDIAQATGVRFQNVSKRLRAASWNEVHQAFRFLEAGVVLRDGGGPSRLLPISGERRNSPSGG